MGLLVLSRYRDESIHIDVAGGIRITVVDIRGDKIRLGIDAPRDIAVHRTEVWEAILRERGIEPERDDRRDDTRGGPRR